MKLNVQWHKEHPMPKNPTLEQRIAWHIEHARACACRPIPQKLQIIIKERASTTSGL